MSYENGDAFAFFGGGVLSENNWHAVCTICTLSNDSCIIMHCISFNVWFYLFVRFVNALSGQECVCVSYPHVGILNALRQDYPGVCVRVCVCKKHTVHTCIHVYETHTSLVFLCWNLECIAARLYMREILNAIYIYIHTSIYIYIYIYEKHTVHSRRVRASYR